jgi:hypothetical protein
MAALTLLTLGEVPEPAMAPLAAHCDAVVRVPVAMPPDAPLAAHRDAVNAAIDAAPHDWLLIVRESESIDDELAREIAAATVDNARAWGFRIRTIRFHAAHPLDLGSARRDGGEVRLFHKRHYLRFANRGAWDEINVQGTVVRLANALRHERFESVAAHRAWLTAHGTPQPFPRRVLLFLRAALQARTIDRNTLRFLWMEAGWGDRLEVIENEKLKIEN